MCAYFMYKNTSSMGRYIYIYIYIYMCTYQPIDQFVREFAHVPGDRGFISDQVISKTQKWYLILL